MLPKDLFDHFLPFSLVIHSWAKRLEWKHGPPTRTSGEKHRPVVKATKENAEAGMGDL